MRETRRGSTVFWIIVGILCFLLIMFPLFGGNWKYFLGFNLDSVLNKVGQIIFFFGGILMVFGFLKLIFSRGGLNGLKPMILGFMLIVIASWIVQPLNIGSVPPRDTAPRGYH